MFKRSDERKLCRLQGYDYSQNGYYFITICVEDMEHRFGRVIDGIIEINNDTVGNGFKPFPFLKTTISQTPKNNQRCGVSTIKQGTV